MGQSWDLSNMKEWYFLVFVAYDDEAIFKASRIVIKVLVLIYAKFRFIFFFFSRF